MNGLWAKKSFLQKGVGVRCFHKVSYSCMGVVIKQRGLGTLSKLWSTYNFFEKANMGLLQNKGMVEKKICISHTRLHHTWSIAN